MGSHEELEGRVSALEAQLGSAAQDAAAARILAGGADRDVAALTSRVDGNTRLLQALRETQVEHGERLRHVENKVDSGFAMLAVGQAEIKALLDRPTDSADESSSAG